IQIQASFIRDISARIRARDHFAAELLDLLDRVNRDVARSGNHDPLAFETAGSRGEHPLDEIHGAVAGCLGPGARAAIDQALPGENTGLVTIGEPLVLAEEITNFA